MRYQIYLDQSTSQMVNALAKADKEKPCTFIKKYLEASFKVAMKKAQEMMREQAEKDQISLESAPILDL